MSDKYKVDASDPGNAAKVVWAAAVLFARVSGMNALNDYRTARGETIGYVDDDYENEVGEAYSALEPK